MLISLCFNSSFKIQQTRLVLKQSLLTQILFPRKVFMRSMSNCQHSEHQSVRKVEGITNIRHNYVRYSFSHIFFDRCVEASVLVGWRPAQVAPCWNELGYCLRGDLLRGRTAGTGGRTAGTGGRTAAGRLLLHSVITLTRLSFSSSLEDSYSMYLKQTVYVINF